MTEEKSKGGRPRKNIDANQVIALARMNGTYDEIAAVLGCSSSLIERRFAAEVKEGREHLKMSLKRAQYVSAVQNGNVTMQIWLGKQILGQRDQVEEIRREPDRRVQPEAYISAVKAALGFTGKLKPLVMVDDGDLGVARKSSLPD